ncbi:hypothetical protein EST38_g8758 [Candolleomyces aberdarensis]|uniref:Protein kinase domain-containing protein n=1 Tax=Candolleomyces aberdarensis TaxID=2316362 RepID=A0A4V1Q323_9AGAR|nr:hypothetical protein EST38_g8758 [Candolleomyces aberdarensis]
MKCIPASQRMATGDTAQDASHDMSMNAVLQHFCSDADNPLGTTSTTQGTLSIPQWLKPSASSDSLVTPIQPDRRFPWDQLEENLKELDASGYQQVIEEGPQDLLSLLDSILSTKKSYRRLLQYQGKQGQLLLLIRETIIWHNHRHPNLLPFKGIFQPDDNFEKAYLVSPFYANGTVVEYLKSQPSVERRLLLLDVLSGLAYLHRNNIVHGDIKGANILVDSQGRACLADLGLLRLTDTQILTWTSIQSTIAPWGTLLWQAPELLSAQLQDQERLPPPTAFSDMYAFGCLAYEIFTGHFPFAELETRGRSHFQVQRMIATQVVKHGRRPQKPAVGSPAYLCYGLTDSIWDTMEKCWERKVRCRPSADDLSKLPFLVDVVDDRSAQE